MVYSISEDNSLYDYAYKSFRQAGLIRWDGNEWWSSLYLASVHLILYFLGISVILGLCEGGKEFQDIIELWSALVTYIIILLKCVCFIARQKKILHLYSRLETLGEEMVKDEENRSFTTEIENFGRKVLKIVSVFFFSMPPLWLLSSTISDFNSNFENRRLLVQMWVPWSMEQTWAYLLAKIWVCFMVTCIVVAFRGVAFFDFIFTFQMSAYLRILQNYLETKGADDKKVFEQHNVLIQLINDYNKIMSGVKFLDIVLSPLMPCGFGITFLKSIRRNEGIPIDTIQRMICTINPAIITCMCGQELIIQVEKLHEASYMSNWYEQNLSYRNNLLVLMTRTTKVTTVNYRLFVTFDRDLLSQVLQRMYSYFMVMVGIMDTTDD